jgi:hypothetical protein
LIAAVNLALKTFLNKTVNLRNSLGPRKKRGFFQVQFAGVTEEMDVMGLTRLALITTLASYPPLPWTFPFAQIFLQG